MRQKSRPSHVIALFGLAAVILALIILAAPTTKITTNAVSGEVYGIDLFGLTAEASAFPEQQFASF